METKTLNIGINKRKNAKGETVLKRRVWLEGKALEKLGWVKGVTYTRKDQLLEDGFTLIKDSAGDLRVAGGEGRPVLDLCGKYVEKALGSITEGYKEVTVKITENKIIITGVTKCGSAAALMPVLVKALGVAA